MPETSDRAIGDGEDLEPHEHAPPPARATKPRKRLVVVAPLAAAAAYALIYLLVPGFADYTRQGFYQLGLYHPRYDPGCREIIVNEHGRFLWGGDREDQHFDITRFSLDPSRLHYGLGRERFPALIEPEFVTVQEIEAASGAGASATISFAHGDDASPPSENTIWPGDGAHVIAVKVGEDVRVYQVKILRRHELINDVVGGRPIFVAYCYLADLGAAYDRRFGDHTLTFAVSGYTYWDPDVWEGRDAFVLWDRETESLWWPPIGRAVSGPLMATPMQVLGESMWSQTTWGEVRQRYPDARVLKDGQRFDPPADWPRLAPGKDGTLTAEDARAVAPPWGENPDL